MTSTATSREDLIAQAKQLEKSADNLDMALLAPSMAARAMREDAKTLREQAAAE